jgi:hypothetical protein
VFHIRAGKVATLTLYDWRLDVEAFYDAGDK